MRHYREGFRSLEDVAWQTDKGIVLASALVDEYRRQQVLLPTLNNIERICAGAITRANRRIYVALAGSLTEAHRARFDALLKLKDESNTIMLGWLRPNGRAMVTCPQPSCHAVLLGAGGFDLRWEIGHAPLPSGVRWKIPWGSVLHVADEF